VSPPDMHLCRDSGVGGPCFGTLASRPASATLAPRAHSTQKSSGPKTHRTRASLPHMRHLLEPMAFASEGGML